jgi:Rrf2 family nitric oxide-sensitive transcriptional repressor
MKLNRKTDYCIRILIYLQLNPGRVKIQDIANSYNISKNHLSVAVNKLADLNYIITSQGPKGGVEFNPDSAQKSVAELITKVEAFEIVECFDLGGNTCNLNPRCKLKKMLKSATNSFISELEKYKIQDLI